MEKLLDLGQQVSEQVMLLVYFTVPKGPKLTSAAQQTLAEHLLHAEPCQALRMESSVRPNLCPSGAKTVRGTEPRGEC